MGGSPRRDAAAAVVVAAREAAGLTLEDVARRVGANAAAVYAIESGGVDPTVGQLQNLMEACGFELRLSFMAPDDERDEAAVGRALLRAVDRVRPGGGTVTEAAVMGADSPAGQWVAELLWSEREAARGAAGAGSDSLQVQLRGGELEGWWERLVSWHAAAADDAASVTIVDRSGQGVQWAGDASEGRVWLEVLVAKGGTPPDGGWELMFDGPFVANYGREVPAAELLTLAREAFCRVADGGPFGVQLLGPGAGSFAP